MKNDNDLILERMRGIPIQEGTWMDKFDPQNPNKYWANDNEPDDPRRDCPWKCRPGDPKCQCANRQTI